MKKNNKRKILCFVLNLGMISCLSIENQDNKAQTNKEAITMSVLVHGTLLPIPSVMGLFRTLKGNKSEQPKKKLTFSAKYLKNIRYTGYHKLQPINSLGLLKVNEQENLDTDALYIKTTKKIINSYKKIDNLVNKKPDNSNNQYFYTFGWDGALNQKSRIAAGKKLYKKIIKEIENIKKSDPDKEIKIEVFAHSHGGNVCLNLAKAEEELKKNLKIEKLVLLGTPIQSETETFVNSSVFEKIYNIYSRGDIVQVADIISTKDSFSGRKFKSNQKKKFVVPDKVKQIEIKVGNKKPLHNELWFTGEHANLLYRKRFAIYPDPVFVYIPMILAFADKGSEKDFSFNLNLSDTKNII